MIKKLKFRKINTCVWAANLIWMWDLKVDILIAVDGDIGDKYYRICVDQNVENSIMYNLGSADTLKEAKELAQKEVELFVKRNFK
jgi:hypothetical protein